MRVITFGYQTWGHRTLSAVLESRHEVVLAVTHPASSNPYEQMWSDSVEELARENGIPVHIAKHPSAGLLEAVRAADADIIVANNWRTWLPVEIFNAPRLGTLNIHDSLLPKYAGFSPLVWALINGDSHVGVTAHLMDEGLDAGPVIGQQSIPVGPKDRTVDLFYRTIEIIPSLLLNALDALEDGTAQAIEQDLSQASYFHKRGEQDSHVDWSWPADAIERLVRAQSDPYPNAFAFHGDVRLRILDAEVSRGRFGGTPGRFSIEAEGGVVVVAGSEAWRGKNPAVILKRLRLDDGTEVSAAEYFAGRGGYLN